MSDTVRRKQGGQQRDGRDNMTLDTYVRSAMALLLCGLSDASRFGRRKLHCSCVDGRIRLGRSSILASCRLAV